MLFFYPPSHELLRQNEVGSSATDTAALAMREVAYGCVLVQRVGGVLCHFLGGGYSAAGGLSEFPDRYMYLLFAPYYKSTMFLW